MCLHGGMALSKVCQCGNSRAGRRVARLGLIASLIFAFAPSAWAEAEPSAAVQVWLTTADRTKLLSREADAMFESAYPPASHIEVDRNRRYQEMVGFGAAITDSSAWLIQNKLESSARSALLEELFGGAPGLGLSFTRLSIGASDFSRHHYSLDDMPPGQTDSELTRFSIDANRADLLPTIKSALRINPSLRVMASPWSAPGWMKTTDNLIKGSLRSDAYGAFSDYLIRYLHAYRSEGVPIYAITLQNEPHFEPDDYPGMRLDSNARARLIGEFVGPRIARSGLQTRILDWDHNWNEPESPLAVLADPAARRYVSGVAWHCYAGNVEAQSLVRDAHPDKDVYFTECSSGQWEPLRSDALVWLTRNLIIGATRGWARGVLFWNLALDERHGPHLGGCRNCSGVVTIDSITGAITRNPEYYALAHASRFVRPGAYRIHSDTLAGRIDTVAFQNADDKSMALIAVNSTTSLQRFSVRSSGRAFQFELPAKSVVTFTWQP